LFLGHSGADTDAALTLKRRIEAAPPARLRGLKVWIDKDDLQAGREWQEQLEEIIERRATAFAVYVGSGGVINWVEREVRLALSRATGKNGAFPFIPILAANSEGSAALPGFARQFQGVRNVENRPEEFQKLVAAVLGGAQAGTLVLETEPFFGLEAIDENRSHLFFGRERETEELLVDQFEEVCTQTPHEQRHWFVDLLLALADPQDEAFAVVLTMRRDYYNLCSEFPTLSERLERDQRRCRYLLGRMSDDDLNQIVTKPLELAGVPADGREALARAVLRDVGERPGDLALVQFALTQAWWRRKSYGNDLLHSYIEVGRVEGGLAGAAERVYQELGGDKNESEIEAVFIRLVRLGDTGGATRRIARRREFSDERWRLVQQLAEIKGNRLVLTSGSEQEPTAEISHEALVTQWPRFQRWLQGAAADKRTLDTLIERIANWTAGGRGEDRVAIGADREAFDKLAEDHPEWLAPQ
jgi:hypothetical protein